MPAPDRGPVGWMAQWWRALLAEVVATALLVSLGCMTLHQAGKTPSLTHPAFGFGFVITGLVQMFGGVSGAHMNPAVSLAAVVMGQLSGAVGAAYATAQLVGSVVGYGLLLALMPAQFSGGCTLPAAHVSSFQAMGVEALMTGVLVLLCTTAWAGGHDVTMPLKFGVVVVGLVYAGGEVTGASLNPARSLAPAIYHGCWSAHWVYWAGPLLGSTWAALLARLLAPPRTPPPPREELPLHDKTVSQ